MPKLKLLAKGSTTFDPNDKERIFLNVQVTDENDSPVKGLKTDSFNVWRGTAAEPIEFVLALSETNMPGIYVIALKNNLGDLRGQVVYVIRAKRTITEGKKNIVTKGWTLADLLSL